MGVVNQSYQATTNLPTLPANTWTQFNISLSALGVANVTNCQGFWFWPTLSVTTTCFYVDSIQLNYASPPSLAIGLSQPKSGLFVVQLNGNSGQTYWMETSTDLVTWTSVSTDILTSASAFLTNTVFTNSERQFWRAVWPR